MVIRTKDNKDYTFLFETENMRRKVRDEVAAAIALQREDANVKPEERRKIMMASYMKLTQIGLENLMKVALGTNHNDRLDVPWHAPPPPSPPTQEPFTPSTLWDSDSLPYSTSSGSLHLTTSSLIPMSTSANSVLSTLKDSTGANLRRSAEVSVKSEFDSPSRGGLGESDKSALTKKRSSKEVSGQQPWYKTVLRMKAETFKDGEGECSVRPNILKK